MVKWTNQSINDLANFINNAKPETEDTVKKYIEKLVDYTDILNSMPNIGSKICDFNTGENLRQMIYRSHKIIYQIKEDDIFILTVLHCKMDFQSALQKLLEN